MSIYIKIKWLNKEKFAKNTSIYQNLIIFSWAFVFITQKKKKKGKYFEIIIDFHFITMAHTAQNSKAYKETYKLWVLTQNKIYKKKNKKKKKKKKKLTP